MPVDIQHRDDVIILKLSGKVIGNTVRDLSKAINAQLADASEAPKVLIDFADVSMMDSSGLGTLMAAHISMARKGGRIAVINVGTNIKNLIVRSRLISTFEHFDGEDEAIVGLTSDNN
jgi:anti-sigma B factor antagonist